MSEMLAVIGYLRRDGSWNALDPWDVDTDRKVNAIRRTLSEALAKRDGAVAIAEVHVSSLLWGERRSDAERLVGEALQRSFRELIKGGPEWHMEQA